MFEVKVLIEGWSGVSSSIGYCQFTFAGCLK
jgi:hypothetical protein